MSAKILAIESSCDETSLCFIDTESPEKPLFYQTISHTEAMLPWGGVVPEVASRNHSVKVIHLIKTFFQEFSPRDIDTLAVTTHPGLSGPLLTGLGAMKTLALRYQKPIIPINHLLAHLEAIHLHHQVPYPYLGLIVSGGHTMVVKVNKQQEMSIIRSTLDDAAGEAFDKGGKLMGLDYPAGPLIDRYAQEGSSQAYSFPIPLKNKNNPEMSFSGLKNALRTFLEKNPDILKDTNASPFKDLCASYQEAIIQTLWFKLQQNRQGYENLPLVIGGGVACNSRLRSLFGEHWQEVFFVPPALCTDNAHMIAQTAALQLDRQIPFPQCLELTIQTRISP